MKTIETVNETKAYVIRLLDTDGWYVVATNVCDFQNALLALDDNTGEIWETGSNGSSKVYSSVKMDVVARAIELTQDVNFQSTLGHPQSYDYCVACEGYRGSYARWIWEIAYTEARLERASKEGNAVLTQGGYVHTAIPIRDCDYEDAMSRYYGF